MLAAFSGISQILSSTGQCLLWYEMRYLRTLRTFGKTTGRGQSRVQGLNESHWGLCAGGKRGKPTGALRIYTLHTAWRTYTYIHTFTSHLNWDFPLTYAVLKVTMKANPIQVTCYYFSCTRSCFTRIYFTIYRNFRFIHTLNVAICNIYRQVKISTLKVIYTKDNNYI